MKTPKQIQDMRVAFSAWLQNPFTAVYLSYFVEMDRQVQSDIRRASIASPQEIPRLCGVAEGLRLAATAHYGAMTDYEESTHDAVTTEQLEDGGAEYLGGRPSPDDVAGEDRGPGGQPGRNDVRPGRAYQEATRSRENRQALLALRDRGKATRH